MKRPLFRLVFGGLAVLYKEAQAIAPYEMLEVVSADPREVHDLCVSEDLLARFDSDHGSKFALTPRDFCFQAFGLRKWPPYE